MAAESAAATALPCCFCQYCMTMAMLAAPQPSFSCLTKGTSSHTPGPSAASARPQRQSATRNFFIGPGLAESHDQQDQHRNANQDEQQIAVADSAGGKIRLRALRAGRKLRQVLIVQGSHCRLDLLRIELRGLERFFRSGSGQELLQRRH